MPKTWLVTGVSSGLGRSLALAADKRGEAVVGTVRNEADRVAFEALSPRLIGLVAAVSGADAVRTAVAAAEHRLGRIDVLVNNALHGVRGRGGGSEPRRGRARVRGQCARPIEMIQAVLPAMRSRSSGHIFNII